MSDRTLIIGDVHGCSAELDDLLATLKPQPDDRILFIGDLINKGPDSPGVLHRFWDLGATSVLGNHELRLRELSQTTPKHPSVLQVKKTFGKDYNRLLKDIRTWPIWIEEADFIAVHAGLVPGKTLKESTAAELCLIRTWDGKGKNLKSADNPAWYDLYKGDKRVVFGHWAALGGLFDHPRALGLDTGCVYGGKLSAVILPEWKVVSVPARKVHCPISK